MNGSIGRRSQWLNARLGRSGPVFADRHHAHVLESRREVANAVRYVTGNYRHHAREWLLRAGWRKEPSRKLLSFEPP
jgi:hypothetical protein